MNFLLSILLSVVVSAQLDSTDLWIGAQSGLHLSAVQSGTEQVQLPVFDREITPGVEIVSRTDVVTKQQDGRIVMQQDTSSPLLRTRCFSSPPCLLWQTAILCIPSPYPST